MSANLYMVNVDVTHSYEFYVRAESPYEAKEVSLELYDLLPAADYTADAEVYAMDETDIYEGAWIWSGGEQGDWE